MHIGHFMVSTNGGTTTLFGPWFPREADNAIFSYERIKLEGTNAQFDVSVYHKNVDEIGDGADTGASFSLRSNNVYTSAAVTGLKELVRLQYKLHQGISELNVAIYRMLGTTWYNTETG